MDTLDKKVFELFSGRVVSKVKLQRKLRIVRMCQLMF